MSTPDGNLAYILFLLLPAVVLFALGLMTGIRWLFLVPILGWPLLFALGEDEGGPLNGVLPAFVSCIGVGLGLMFHRPRAESSR